MQEKDLEQRTKHGIPTVRNQHLLDKPKRASRDGKVGDVSQPKALLEIRTFCAAQHSFVATDMAQRWQPHDIIGAAFVKPLRKRCDNLKVEPVKDPS